MSDTRPPNPADDSDDSSVPDTDSSAPPEKKTPETEKPESPPTDQETKTEAPRDASPAAESTAPETESTAKPDVDLEGVRAATVISMSGGPRSSRAKWAFIELGIKLFKLTARFFPIILMLAGMAYSYIHFFGFPPVVEKVLTTPTVEKITSNPTVDAMLNTVGIDLPTPEERAAAKAEAEASGTADEPTSKVGKMLQQTRDVVAASNKRVNLGNALASGDFEAAEELIESQEEGEGGDGEAAAGAGGGAGGGSGDALSAGAQAMNVPEPVSVSTYAGSNAVWAEFRDEADGAAAVAELLGEEEEAEPEIPREVVYQSDVMPSPAFKAWVRSAQIGGVLPGPVPKALINNMTFQPGEVVDYGLRVSFEGLAEDDSLIVFKDGTNAYITVPR